MFVLVRPAAVVVGTLGVASAGRARAMVSWFGIRGRLRVLFDVRDSSRRKRIAGKAADHADARDGFGVHFCARDVDAAIDEMVWASPAAAGGMTPAQGG